MSVAIEESVSAPAVLRLRTVHGQGQEVWTAQLSDGLFVLNAPDGRLVMMLPLEAAAKHIRFQRDLLHGQTLRVNVLEGLKAHVFKLSPEDVEALLRWLPHRGSEELTQEVRLYGMALVLLGAAHLLFQDLLYWGWGLAFTGAGVAAVLHAKRRMFAVNGTILAFIGLMLLFATPFPDTSATAHLVYTVLGSLLLLWAVQQFSLLGPHHRLRTVHDAQRESLSPGRRHRSRLVQAVAVCAVLLALVFSIYATALFFTSQRGTAPANDFIIFGGLAALFAFSAVVLFLRRYPPYLEAKIVAQLMIATAVLYAWGLTAGYALGDPLAFSRGMLAAGLLRFEEPYVWAPLIVLLLLFGRWFIQAADRDAERAQEESSLEFP
jgi:hypothetical protein